jgi:acyl-CoA thioesterase
LEDFYDDDHEFNKIEEDFREYVHTHQRLAPSAVGKIRDIKEGYARTEFKLHKDMAVDEHDLAFTGYIFNAANYAAMIAVNEPNVIISSAKTMFLLPIKVGEVLTFEAISKHRESKKKMIRVTATQQGVKVFEGEFATLVYDSHVLDVRLYDREDEK